MKYAVGVDIGGTKTAIGVVNEKGEPIVHETIVTDLTISPEAMINRMIDTVNTLIEKSDISHDAIIGIGVGAPGPLDSFNGIITCPPNLPEWRDIPLKKMMEAAFSFPVKVENDANAAALAEGWIGGGQDVSNYVYMTISTGIGAGIITEGQLLRGRKGNAGDIGHIVVNPAYGTCPCGQKGCLEWIASGTAIARIGSDIIGRTISTKDVFDLYDEGHKEIVAFVEDVLTSIGQACVTLINTFDTEKIIIGGGVTQVGYLLFNSIRQYVSQFALNPDGRQVEIAESTIGAHNGLIGAAALWLDQ